MKLASYAIRDTNSRGRLIPESKPRDGRTEFARDRDRVLHSESFRRLGGKTQVFTLASQNYGTYSQHISYNDNMRTRMSHSLEVAQVARSIATALNLNADLAETLGLAHDLGHTPFGHSGQDVLNNKMKNYGGFEHNIQSLRIVDVVEKNYIAFNGLNLMFETREGILKHCSPKNVPLLGDVAERHKLKKSPTLEAQTTDLSDAIAYLCHDIDDGINSKLITPNDLMDAHIFARCWEEVNRKYPNASESLKVKETIRDIMGLMIRGTIIQSKQNIEDVKIKTLDDVRNAPDLILLPDGLAAEHKNLKSHLYKVLYHNPEINNIRKDVESVLNILFDTYMAHPELIAKQGASYMRTENKQDYARYVCDYIAGMTDAYAYQQAQKVEYLCNVEKTISIL